MKCSLNCVIRLFNMVSLHGDSNQGLESIFDLTKDVLLESFNCAFFLATCFCNHFPWCRTLQLLCSVAEVHVNFFPSLPYFTSLRSYLLVPGLLSEECLNWACPSLTLNSYWSSLIFFCVGRDSFFFKLQQSFLYKNPCPTLCLLFLLSISLGFAGLSHNCLWIKLLVDREDVKEVFCLWSPWKPFT